MAQIERFRGSSEIPLLPEGLEAAHKLGMQLQQKGGLDRIMSSSLGRTVNTAKIISQHTHAPITYIGDGLHPWHLGALEGQPVDKDGIDLMNHLIKEQPDVTVPGRSPQSTNDGESFNDFKGRTLNFLKEVVAQHKSRPDEKVGLVTHYRVRKLLEAWMRKGMDPDGVIDTDEMTKHDMGSQPGSLERFRVDPYTGPQIEGVDLKSPSPLTGGLYFIRHEKTPWNAPKGQQGGTGQS